MTRKPDFSTAQACPQPAQSTDAVLRLSAISRTYGVGQATTHALRSVSLTVQEGEFVAVVGPSGAGKSTLLNILGLLETATNGTYILNGRNVDEMGESDRNRTRSHEIGFVFQASHMMVHSTAAENTALSLSIQGVPIGIRTSLVQAALGRVGLLHRSNEFAKNLSGGERQRAAIARAIATEPRLLLADEPTGALDTTHSEHVIEYLQELNRSGMTIVVITHDPLVARAANRQVHLIDGVLDDGVRPPCFPEVSSKQSQDAQRAHRRRLISDVIVWRRLLDEFAEAISSHTGRPGRTLLLLLAFLLGAGGLVSSLGISQSASQQVADRLTQASLDEVVVFPNDQIPVDDPFYLATNDDSAQAIIRGLDGVQEVGFRAPLVKRAADISVFQPGTIAKVPEFTGSVIIADAGLLEVQQATVSPPSAAEQLDNSWGGAIALVSEDAAHQLGLRAPGEALSADGTYTGVEHIWVGGRKVDVVGRIENSGRDPMLENSIVLSRAAARGLETAERTLVVRTDPGYPAPLAEAIPLAIDAGNPTSTKIMTVADLRGLRMGVTNDLGALVSIMSLVLLALASLSSATAMYLSVQSRASEIALRRAIGASRSSIWRMFTFEGLSIGVAGGIAGSTVGVFGVLVVCAVQHWTPVLDVRILSIGLLAGACTGFLSSMYPALVAAKASPADAIRG